MKILLPELAMLLVSIVFLILSLFKHKGSLRNVAQMLAFFALFVSVINVFAQGDLFHGAYKVDLFSQIFKILIVYGYCLILFMFNNKDETDEGYVAEYYMFLSLSALGLMMLVSSVELISIVIALEISSYSLYVIIPLRKSNKRVQLEAAMKYLFFGAISTGVMLYGMGYVYGIAKSTFLVDIAEALPRFINEPIGVFAVMLMLAGFFFKLSLFPMHFWAPDIYEGASNTTTTFIATIPKVAAGALLIRIAMLIGTASPDLIKILTILAALSMTIGNLVGLVQKDIKRLLAYSGIAHAGYLMIGLIAFNNEGYASVIYYSAIYLFMNLGCFYVIMLLSKNGANVKTDDLPGLARRAPLIAFALAVFAFSLAGIPPTGGFTGKLFLLTSAFRQGHLAIVIIGAVNTVISIFFYLNLVRMSYSKDSAVVEPMKFAWNEKLICLLLVAIVLYLGIMPSGLFEIFRSVL